MQSGLWLKGHHCFCASPHSKEMSSFKIMLYNIEKQEFWSKKEPHPDLFIKG